MAYGKGTGGDHCQAAAPDLAQIFDALSYYSDHQEEINAYIERNHVPDELLDPLVRNP